MSENSPEVPIIENVEPPEVKLTAPTLSETESTWLVVAKNRRVNRDWKALIEREGQTLQRRMGIRGDKRGQSILCS
ncbi:hypothetical protein [Nostoc sp. FACHB-133]|uniref:hypothetical protein n=1 Tax=Nostoc sp. FACHB-133 TaxID=2692835 RepID=UPI001F54AEFB|nr:hypothetical protein [Nostoc sp. FACHB-133]